MQDCYGFSWTVFPGQAVILGPKSIAHLAGVLALENNYDGDARQGNQNKDQKYGASAHKPSRLNPKQEAGHSWCQLFSATTGAATCMMGRLGEKTSGASCSSRHPEEKQSASGDQSVH